MNHQLVYNNLILRAQSEKRKKETRYNIKKYNLNVIYYEKHHIVPKCMGGSDNDDNLALLTFKEHYVAHKLLTYIYPKNIKIIYAFKSMIYRRNDKAKEYRVSARDYVMIKTLIRENKQKQSRESIEKRIKSNTGKKRSVDYCIRNRNRLIGHPVSEETREKIRLKLKGKSMIELLGEEKAKARFEKASRSLKGNTRGFKKGVPSPNKGKKYMIDENGIKRIIKNN